MQEGEFDEETPNMTVAVIELGGVSPFSSGQRERRKNMRESTMAFSPYACEWYTHIFNENY